jgi:hypothetical protein
MVDQLLLEQSCHAELTRFCRVQKYRNKARVTTAEADHLCKFSTETVTERKQVRQWHTVARPVSVYGHSCQMVAHRIRAWRSWRTVWRRQCRWGHRTDYQNFREARWVWRNVRTQRSVKKCSIDPCNNGYQVRGTPIPSSAAVCEIEFHLSSFVGRCR